MNRIAGWVSAAVAAACCSAPGLADAPKPSLTIEPIVAHTLLAPVDEVRSPSYRLDPGLDPASGQRARLSIDLGDATLFAITGRLNRQPAASGALDPGHFRAIGPRRDSGKVYGAGLSHSIRGIDLSATYQYSKLNAEQAEADSQLRDDGPGRSHSARATVRIRFRH